MEFDQKRGQKHVHPVEAFGQVVVKAKREVLIFVAKDVDEVVDDGVLREVNLAELFDVDELVSWPRVGRKLYESLPQLPDILDRQQARLDYRVVLLLPAHDLHRLRVKLLRFYQRLSAHHALGQSGFRPQNLPLDLIGNLPTYVVILAASRQLAQLFPR